MKRSVFLASGLCLALVASLLGACGGGGDNLGAEAMSPQSTELRGVVVDGAPGAKVFLDLNNNQSHDAGEPATATLAEGVFTLQVGRRSTGELASAMLVAEVPDSARDRDDAGLTLKEAGRGGYQLMAPAAASVGVDSAGRQTASLAVVSPLTTMVAAEVAFNGLTPGQAAQTVQKQLGLGDADPLADYNAHGDSVLRNIARAAAIAMGESPVVAGEPMRSRLSAVTTRLKTALPSVIADLDLKSGRQAGVRVASVKQALAAIPDLRPSIDSLAATGNRFIVKFRDSVHDPDERGRRMSGAGRAELRHSFSRALKGFAVTVPDDAVQDFLDATLNNPDVDRVEADGVVTTLQAVQTNSTWGLDRTDQRALPLSTTYSYLSTGSGVRAYIIDTGIFAHDDFRARMVSGFTVIGDGRGTNDCHGHGTHVAGTVGGTTWGMAKGVTLVPVRVLDCRGNGSVSGVIAGIDWMVAHAVKPAVANISLGGSRSALVDEAVARAVAAGITVSVAAGNNNLNACGFSPAGEPTAMTVGATTSADVRASFSNYGTCVDVFAPGASITSAGHSSRTATAVKSGTSMAAPHVTGLVALYLQSNPTASPAEVEGAIKAAASTGKVGNVGFGSPDALIYTDLSSVPPPPEPPISSPPLVISSPVPPAPPPPPSVSVAALSGSSSMVDRTSWRASVTIAVKNASGALVQRVAVRGKFTVGGSSVGCTTAPNGTCVINTGKLGSKTLQTNFTVVSLALSGTPYDSRLNTATSLVIARP